VRRHKVPRAVELHDGRVMLAGGCRRRGGPQVAKQGLRRLAVADHVIHLFLRGPVLLHGVHEQGDECRVWVGYSVAEHRGQENDGVVRAGVATV